LARRLVAFAALLVGLLSPARSFADAPVAGHGTRAESRTRSETLAKDASKAVRERDYDRAIALLREAIESHPHDVGAKYDPWTMPLHDKGALEHGRQQLERMLRDRPQMCNNIRPSDLLWKWAVAKYAAKIDGLPIEWSDLKPSNNSDAENYRPYDGNPGQIRVKAIDARRADAAAFETLWMNLVFELHNIENAKEFNAIDANATEGLIEKDAYVKRVFMVEWKTMERTRKWYVEVFLPHAKRYKLPTDPALWYCDTWGTVEEDFARYTNRTDYPWEPYSTQFRELRSAGAIAHFFKAVAGVADLFQPRTQ
jgi:hypothetical protein